VKTSDRKLFYNYGKPILVLRRDPSSAPGCIRYVSTQPLFKLKDKKEEIFLLQYQMIFKRSRVMKIVTKRMKKSKECMD
jgi:hypothetical protein